MYSKEFINGFWNKVNCRNPDECWFWTGVRGCNGYGVYQINKKPVRAHRIAWQITHGLIPDGLLCLHKCDRPSCVNPEHLYIGNHKDNIRDKVERFRREPEVDLSRVAAELSKPNDSWFYKAFPM